MIQLQGVEIHPPGGPITFVVKQINTLFKTNETLNVWLIDSDFTMITDFGWREYGHWVVEDGKYEIIVAARRPEQNVAGIIGMQYGLYLQHYLQREQDLDEAVTFAKYATARSTKQPRTSGMK